MRSLPNCIMEHIEARPEAAPLCPDSLLHLGNRSAVDQALSRLSRAGKLMRICCGVYMRPIKTRFGVRGPSVYKVISALSALWGETIVPSGGAAANRLGLSTQNPVRMVYLTSGASRRLHFGKSTVELRHAPHWQLVAPNRKAGELIRALAWLGPAEVEEGLNTVLPELSQDEIEELASASAILPSWLAEPLCVKLANF